MHTPGPWTLGNGYKTAPNHAICKGPFIIAKVNGNGYPIGEGWSPESQEDANLMVAAPEMYEALQGLLREFSNQRFNVRKDFSKILYIEAARRAIAKAKGE